MKQVGIVHYGYVPTVDFNWDMYPEGYINNEAVKYLVDEFCSHHTKNILSHSDACEYYINSLAIQGIKCTKDDVEEAYNFCYGHGAEYEWEFE